MEDFLLVVEVGRSESSSIETFLGLAVFITTFGMQYCKRGATTALDNDDSESIFWGEIV